MSTLSGDQVDRLGVADRREVTRGVWLLAGGLLGVYTSSFALATAWPLISRRLGLGDLVAGLIYAMAFLPAVPAGIALGRVVARHGVRRTASASAVLFAVATLGLAALCDAGMHHPPRWLVPGLMVLLAAEGTGATVVAISGFVFVGSGVEIERRTAAFAVLTAANGLGALSGPALVWGTARWVPSAPLYAGGALALAGALLLARVPSLRGAVPAAESTPWALGRRALPPLLVLFAAFVGAAVTLMITGWFVQDAITSDATRAGDWTGVLLTVAAVAFVLAQAVVGTRTGRPLGPMAAGAASTVVAGYLVTAPMTLAAAVPAYAALGAGVGLILPGAYALTAAAAPPGAQGDMGGALYSVLAASNILGPIAGAWAYGFGPTVPFRAVALGSAVLLVAFVWADRKP